MLTKQEVIDVAKELILENGSTSTLEVKNQLRDNGVKEHYAYQQNVSDLMNELNDDNELSFTFNGGTYREYKLSNIPTINLTLKAKIIKAKTRKISIITQLQNPHTGCWIAYDKDGIEHNIYFDENISRGKVRVAYKNLTGIHYNKSLCKKYN